MQNSLINGVFRNINVNGLTQIKLRLICSFLTRIKGIINDVSKLGNPMAAVPDLLR
jgi:hypothetical protein